MSRERAVMPRTGILQETFAGHGLVNMYEKLPKHLKKELKNPPGYHLTHIGPAARIVVAGNAGSMKTNAVINFINMQGFQKLFIFNRTLEQDKLYQMVIEKCDPDQIVTGTSLDEIPDLAEFDPDMNNCVIIDDLMLSKDQTKAIELYTNARKYNVTVVYVVQSLIRGLAGNAKLIRENTDYFWLFRMSSLPTVKRVLREFPTEYSVDELLKMYQFCSQKKGCFLMIDLLSTDPHYKVRLNFGPPTEPEKKLKAIKEESDHK